MLTIKNQWPNLVVLIISTGLILLLPVVETNIFLLGLMTSIFITVVYVVSWDLLEGYTGMLCFGQLLFAGVAAYTVALLELNTQMPRHLVIPCGVFAGTCSSLCISLPSLRVRSTYFAVVSFVNLLIFQRITMTFLDVFGGEYGLSFPRVYSRTTLYCAAIIIMAATLIAARFLVKSRFGKALQAIREDEETARAVGINVKRYKFLISLISAFFTSLAGICFFYMMGHVGPEIFGMNPSFDVVIMGVIGGVGTIYGAALGGVLLSLLLEIMRPVAEYRNLIYTSLLVLTMMLAAKGIWGSTLSIFRKRVAFGEVKAKES